jgi:hypothetical protein
MINCVSRSEEEWLESLDKDLKGDQGDLLALLSSLGWILKVCTTVSLKGAGHAMNYLLNAIIFYQYSLYMCLRFLRIFLLLVVVTYETHIGIFEIREPPA